MPHGRRGRGRGRAVLDAYGVLLMHGAAAAAVGIGGFSGGLRCAMFVLRIAFDGRHEGGVFVVFSSFCGAV